MVTERSNQLPPTVNNPTFVPPNTQTSTQTNTPPISTQKNPGKFARILGGIAGGALNLIVPGAGTAIGGMIGGSGIGIGSGPDYGQMEAMLERSAQQQMQMLNIQSQLQNQSQEFTTITNLLKARHDGEMAAVHNLKS